MKVKEAKIRHIVQSHYNQGEKSDQATKKLFTPYEPNTLSNATAKRWFHRFRSGNMNAEKMRQALVE